MAYATITDLYTYGAPESAFSGLDESTLTAGLDAASVFVDGYLRSRYKLPLTSWGTDITRTTAIVATYDLLTARGYNPMGPDQLLQVRYDNAVKWLRGVATQAIQASVTPTEIEAGYPEPYVRTNPRRW